MLPSNLWYKFYGFLKTAIFEKNAKCSDRSLKIKLMYEILQNPASNNHPAPGSFGSSSTDSQEGRDIYFTASLEPEWLLLSFFHLDWQRFPFPTTCCCCQTITPSNRGMFPSALLCGRLLSMSSAGWLTRGWSDCVKFTTNLIYKFDTDMRETTPSWLTPSHISTPELMTIMSSQLVWPFSSSQCFI